MISYELPYKVTLELLIWVIFLYMIEFWWNLKFLIWAFSLYMFKFFHFPLDWNWTKMLSNRVFSYDEQIFSFSCWLELIKNALKSRFLLWCANLKLNFLGDEGGGQALGNLKESKKWKIVKIVKIAKNEKIKKWKKSGFFDFWQKWNRLIFAFSI